MTKPPIEPFRIKVVEPIRLSTREERVQILEQGGYNIFNIPAHSILVDLLTDSGTAAMSQNQWAGIMVGDESYAGSRNFDHFESTIKDIMGFKYVIPTHQGRASEHVLFSALQITDKDRIPNNAHFDTTRANIEFKGGQAYDLTLDDVEDPSIELPFKGNIDLEKLSDFISTHGAENIPIGMLTITNNRSGGQPVSMANIRQTKELLQKHNIPLFLDCCRFAENAWFIKQREEGYADKSIPEIVTEMFSYADGCTMSAKKDGISNIGGFIGVNNEELANRIKMVLTLYEGFPTYGGLAGRDLEAIAIGLREALREDYLNYRIGQVHYLGELLDKAGVPLYKPFGGHAIYMDALSFMKHLPQSQLPGHSLAIYMYQEAAIRACEIGTVMFMSQDSMTGEWTYPSLDLVRMAVPRRVYTNTHIEYVAEQLAAIAAAPEKVKGLKMTYDPKVLRHFRARFEPV